jgi:hypothetical protein
MSNYHSYTEVMGMIGRGETVNLSRVPTFAHVLTLVALQNKGYLEHTPGVWSRPQSKETAPDRLTVEAALELHREALDAYTEARPRDHQEARLYLNAVTATWHDFLVSVASERTKSDINQQEQAS